MHMAILHGTHRTDGEDENGKKDEKEETNPDPGSPSYSDPRIGEDYDVLEDQAL